MSRIEEILRKPIEERKKDYQAKGIEKVIIDGNEFTDYGAFSFLWEKSYVKSPVRSGDGSIDNLDSYATFLTPHLTIDFSLMDIDSYRRLMNLIYKKNEFVVECYDVVNNKTTSNKMYFTTEEMPKLVTLARALNGESWTEILGVEDYTVELVGTNTSLDLVNVIYYPHFPDNVTDIPKPEFEAEDNVYKGQQVVIGQSSTYKNNPPNGYKFKCWTDENGIVYDDGSVVTLNDSLRLNAEWQTSQEYTLSFNYGISKPTSVTPTEEDKLYNRTVQYGQSIKTLPTFDASPSVVIDKKPYYPYYNGAWYKLPVMNDAAIVKDNDAYWINRDSIIYLLFDIHEYSITYITNTESLHLPSISIKYGQPTILPQLQASTIFDGWYLDDTFQTKAPSVMPPYNITVYAKWQV